MSEIVDAYRAAAAAKVDLDMTPRWRRRKRARLEDRLDRLCEQADAAMARRMGRPPPRRLRDLLDAGVAP